MLHYQNQMREAVRLFESILKLPNFDDCPVFLLFTKLDLFKEKIKRKPLSDLFPEFTGPKGDRSAALQFLTDKFLSLNSKAKRKIEVHSLDTTDKEQARMFLQILTKTAMADQGHVWDRNPG